MFEVLILVSNLATILRADDFISELNHYDLDCKTGKEFSTTLTGYYHGDFCDDDSVDLGGNTLSSLQDFIDGRVPYVTVAADRNLGLDYGTKICIPELNHHFGQKINFEVRDTNSDLNGYGFSRFDICVRSEADSYDSAVNKVTKVVLI